MLAQFQNQYPNGSLISELLTIYQGKFVVRVSVQIEGRLRSTGMSMSESLELAEDQARFRALMVLGIQPAPTINEAQNIHQVSKKSIELEPESDLHSGVTSTARSSPSETIQHDFFSPTPGLAQSSQTISLGQQSPAAQSELFEPNIPKQLPNSASLPPKESKITASTPESSSFFENSSIESDVSVNDLDWSSPTPSSTGQKFSFGSVTPQTPLGYSQDADSFLPIESEPAEINDDEEPADLSDLIAKVQIQLEISSWNAKQEGDYLQRTYSKRSREQLNAEELSDFLSYLELFNQTTEKINKLKWTKTQGQNYLSERFGQRSRHLLNKQEMREFLEDLESMQT